MRYIEHSIRIPICIIALCTTVAPLTILAQTISLNDVLPPIGAQYLYYYVTALPDPQVVYGNDNLWDHGDLGADSSITRIITHLDPSDVPGASSFPDADRAVRYLDVSANTTADRFLDIQDGSIFLLGILGAVDFDHDQPELIQQLPMSLGDTVHQAYCYWSDGFGVQLHWCGEGHITFNATGTLILPYGTFENVVQVSHWKWTLETTQPGADTSFLARRSWYAPGIAEPILEISFFTDSEGFTVPNTWMMDAAHATSIADGMASGTNWRIFPNPTTGALFIDGDLDGPSLLTVHSPDGKVISVRPGFISGSGEALQLDHLPSGMYFIGMQNQHGRSVRSFVKH